MTNYVDRSGPLTPAELQARCTFLGHGHLAAQNRSLQAANARLRTEAEALRTETENLRKEARDRRRALRHFAEAVAGTDITNPKAIDRLLQQAQAILKRPNPQEANPNG